MDEENSDKNKSRDCSIFAFSTPISEPVPDWKLVLSATDSDVSVGETIKATDREISPIPFQLCKNEDTENIIYDGKPLQKSDTSDKIDAKAEQLTSHDESLALASNEELFRKTFMNPLGVDRCCISNSSANIQETLDFKSIFKSVKNKEIYDAKQSKDNFAENFINNFESDVCPSNYTKEIKALADGDSYSDDYSSNNETSHVLVEDSTLIKSKENCLFFSSPDSSNEIISSSESISQIPNSCASIFRPIYCEELSVEREKDNPVCEINEDLPELIDRETYSSFLLTSTTSQNDTILDDTNQRPLEIIYGTDNETILEDMEGLEFDGPQMFETTLNATDGTFMNSSASPMKKSNEGVFVLKNFDINPFRIISPIPELSCENSSQVAGETNYMKMADASTSSISENNKNFASEKKISVTDNCATCKVTELSSTGTEKGLTFAHNDFKMKNEEMKRDVTKIMNSLMIEAEAYKNNIQPDPSKNSPRLTNEKTPPIIIKLCSPSTANLGDSGIETSTDMTELRENNFKNLPATNLEDISINGNDNSIQDEKMSISPDNRNMNSKNQGSPMEVSDTTPSCSHDTMANFSCSFPDFSSLKKLDNVNKTVANAVLKSMLELGNNKVSIPQVLKYITQHKIMQVHSKLEKDVRHFFKVVYETGMLKKTKDHRYTLFGYKNSTHGKKNVIRLTEVKSLSKKIKREPRFKTKASRNSTTQQFAIRSRTKSVAIAPKGAICRQLRNRTVLFKH